MTVAVDGIQRYQWPVSTGNPSHETPNGSFRAFRMEEDHYSKEFDDAPMPHSIFFTKIGHAIHGTESEGRLGTPVSHGCVRLSRANASTLYALVEQQGVLNTTVTLTGSASGRAGAQSAHPGGQSPSRAATRPRNTLRNITPPASRGHNAAAVAARTTIRPAGAAPMTVISIRPTAVRTARAIRRRAAAGALRRAGQSAAAAILRQ